MVATVMTALLLLPAFNERHQFLALNRQWGEENLAAWRADTPAVEEIASRLQTSRGRVFPTHVRYGGNMKHSDRDQQHKENCESGVDCL